LWFAVDIYHRERYFFICGCKRIVKNQGVKSLRQSAERREIAVISPPDSRSLQEVQTTPIQAPLKRMGQEIHRLFPIERIP
jgi:hypothetical protein